MPDITKLDLSRAVAIGKDGRVIPPPPPAPEPRLLARPFRRMLAHLLDLLPLAAAAMLLGGPLRERLLEMGPWGRFAGWGVYALWFGVFTSSLTGGRTYGMRITRLRLADARGQALPLPLAILRALVCGLPLFVNGLRVSLPTPAMQLGLAFVGLGTLFAWAWLGLFNRATGQMPHDLATGAFMLNRDAAAPPARAFWKGHFLVLGAVLGLMLAGLQYLDANMRANPQYAALTAVRAKLQADPRLWNAGVELKIPAPAAQKQPDAPKSADKPAEPAPPVEPAQPGVPTVVITLLPRPQAPGDDVLARDAAQALAQAAPELAGTPVEVRVTRGWDLGFFNYWQTVTLAFPGPEQPTGGQAAGQPGS